MTHYIKVSHIFSLLSFSSPLSPSSSLPPSLPPSPSLPLSLPLTYVGRGVGFKGGSLEMEEGWPFDEVAEEEEEEVVE